IDEKVESRWKSYLEDENKDEERQSWETSGNVSLLGHKETTLNGHVTTDWREFNKRKRKIQSEYPKQKYFKRYHQRNTADFEINSDVSVTEDSVLQTRTEPIQQASLLMHNAKTFPDVRKVVHVDQTSCNNVQKATANKCVKKSWSPLMPKSQDNISRFGSQITTDASSPVVGLNSGVNQSKKILPQTKSVVPSRWTIFVSNDESEEDEEFHLYENQF
ncbi:hypothetical protein PoB_006165700, partial [Plakobranchus ocellatus]